MTISKPTVGLPGWNAATDTAIDVINALGNSATRAVGTTTGTVAAGDDTRITGALPKSGGTMTGTLVLSSTPMTNPSALSKGFVYAQGTNLMCNGSPYLVLGANVYDLLDSSTTEANTRLTELASYGINTVRCWAFSNDGTAGTAMRARLTTALANAATHGIKLLLTLGNHYSDWGGPDKFGLTQSTWYQNFNATWWAQVAQLISEHLNDAAVFGWEVLNEPRPNNDVPSMQWLEIASGRIKQLDPDHLVTSGSEGFVSFHYPTATAQSGASVDIGLRQLNYASGIDCATAHLYTKYLTSDFRPDSAKTLDALRSMKTVANTLRKPLIIGECGFDPGDFSPGVASRTQFLHDVAASIREVGGSGGFIWNWGRLSDVGSFTLAEGDADSHNAMITWVSTLTTGDHGIVPTTVTRQVASSGDDTFHSFNSSVSSHVYSTTANDVPVGLYDTTQTALGAAMRFTGIAVPKNAVIVSASLSLVASSTDSATTVRSKIRGMAADNAVIPPDDATFHAPGYTTAVVNWDSIPTWNNGTTYTSPDITAIVQELVNRSGWVSGNAMVILWDDLDLRSTQSSGVIRRGQSYNNTPANAPSLTISYTT